MDTSRQLRSSQGQRYIVALGKVFFDQPVERQVGQDSAAIDDKNFIPNSMLNVFDPSSRLQQVRLLYQLERDPAIFVLWELGRKFRRQMVRVNPETFNASLSQMV